MTTPVARVRDVVELILADLRGGRPAAGGAIAVDPAELSSLRATFVAGGAAAVHRALHPERWLDVSLTLEPLEPAWMALMRGELPRQITTWVEEGQVRRMFFMNKPPGLRLRLLGVVDSLMPALLAALEAQVEQGIVARFDVGPYDAEVAQFGGPEGLALAHEYFTRESVFVFEYQRLRLTTGVGLPAAAMSLVLLHMLLRQVTEDEWELWDVWTKMTLTGRLPAEPSLDPGEPVIARALALRPSLLPLLRDDERAFARACPEEAAALRRYRQGLPALVQALRRARSEGALAWGLREILPFWIIFHWNRMGFDLLRQQQMALLMAAVLNPKL